MKKLSFCLSILCVALFAVVAKADQVVIDIDNSVDTGVIYDDVFFVSETVAVNFISIELATTWGGDFEITLTSPDAQVYTLMFDEVDNGAAGGSGNFDMGAATGDGTLGNVVNYVFVESGGLTEWDDTLAPAGTYNSNITARAGGGATGWGTGTHSAGNWRLLVVDDAGGDDTAAGQFVLDFDAAVPEPGSMLFLIGGMGLVALRRRR